MEFNIKITIGGGVEGSRGIGIGSFAAIFALIMKYGPTVLDLLKRIQGEVITAEGAQGDEGARSTCKPEKGCGK